MPGHFSGILKKTFANNRGGPKRGSSEQQARTTSSNMPITWKCFVDDTSMSSEQPATFFRERENDNSRFTWHCNFKRTWWPPHHQRIQKSNAHRPYNYNVFNETQCLMVTLSLSSFLSRGKSPRPENLPPVRDYSEFQPSLLP